MRLMDWLLVLGASALLSSCGDSGLPKHGDGGADGGASAGGLADGGGTVHRDAGMSAAHFGSPCKKTADCGRALFCDQEIDTSFPADKLPPGTKDVPQSVFPGGLCSPMPAAVYDPKGVKSCNPGAPKAQQGCGSDGTCIAVQISSQKTEVACRPSCDPSDAKGCGRTGYTCDFGLKACVEGCQSDVECRLVLLDGNGDGMADGLAYDDQSKAICDTKTFRCVLHGASSARPTGAACDRLDDCEAEGLCLQSLQTYGGLPFPGGYCTKLGCDLKGRDCNGQHAICAEARPWSPGLLTGQACFQSCEVGAEPESDQLGVNGHGKGCRPGYRCHYNGNPGAEQGICAGGNYNDVRKNNVGQTCKVDADCYSPFGLGNCIALSVGGVQPPSSVCTIMDCSVPGIPSDVCGGSGDCIGLNGDVTFCAKTCLEASECAAGYACADDDGDPSTAKICYPACFTDADCRKGQERCNATATTMVGSCVASRQ